MLERCGKKTNCTVSASEDGWYKPQVACVSIDRGLAAAQVHIRYGVSWDDVLRVEALMDSVSSLPVFLEDPVFLALAAKDYS